MAAVEWLVWLGLSIMPFIVIQGYDMRYPKEVFAVGVATAIALYAIYMGLLKPFKNKAILMFILLGVIATTQVPPTGMMLGIPIGKTVAIQDRIDIDNLWNWKPIAFWFIFLLMAVSIASIDIKDFTPYFNVIAWIGTLMALTVLLQKLGFQQWWHILQAEQFNSVKSRSLTGFLGQYTLVSGFISICFLASVYIKKYWMAALMIAAVLLCKSNFAYLAVIIALCCIPYIKTARKGWLLLLPVVVAASFILMRLLHINDNGRFYVWSAIMGDLTNPLSAGDVQYSFTGFGAGAFHYIFRIVHFSPFFQAHNEFLEAMYNNGVFGFILLMSAIFLMVRQCLSVDNLQLRFFFCMFLVSCVVACGTFIWQLGVGMFYTTVILGCIYNILRKASENAVA